jgi:hypothetical protein
MGLPPFLMTRGGNLFLDANDGRFTYYDAAAKLHQFFNFVHV